MSYAGLCHVVGNRGAMQTHTALCCMCSIALPRVCQLHSFAACSSRVMAPGNVTCSQCTRAAAVHTALCIALPHGLPAVASPAMGHWGTCPPPRLLSISFLVHFGVNLSANYPSMYYAVCEIADAAVNNSQLFRSVLH